MYVQIDAVAERSHNPLGLLFVAGSAIPKKDEVQRRHKAVLSCSKNPIIPVISFYGISNVLLKRPLQVSFLLPLAEAEQASWWTRRPV